MSEDTFADIEHNPHEKDIPVGFGLLLEGEPTAKSNFEKLTASQKNDLIEYMQQAKTGEESEDRVMDAVRRLKENRTN